jgi:hypothetical protein
MNQMLPHTRRAFLVASTGVAVSTLTLTTAGCADATNARSLAFSRLDEAFAELGRLHPASPLSPAIAWNWVQTLNHCAQSIEYSMSGYPEAKSALFQRTVGAAAFEVFRWRGRMTHNLGEPIPGAPVLDAGGDAAASLQRLVDAIEAFKTWSGPLKPHFAYGELSKGEYEQAHAMHLANHFAVFERAG